MTGLITPIEDNHFRYIYQRKSIHYPYTATKKGPSPVDSLDPEGAWRGGQRGIDARDVGIGRGGVNKSLLCQCSPTSAPVYIGTASGRVCITFANTPLTLTSTRGTRYINATG